MYHDVPTLHAGLSMNRTKSYKSLNTASSLNRLQDIRYWPTRMSSLFFFARVLSFQSMMCGRARSSFFISFPSLLLSYPFNTVYLKILHWLVPTSPVKKLTSSDLREWNCHIQLIPVCVSFLLDILANIGHIPSGYKIWLWKMTHFERLYIYMYIYMLLYLFLVIFQK